MKSASFVDYRNVVSSVKISCNHNNQFVQKAQQKL